MQRVLLGSARELREFLRAMVVLGSGQATHVQASWDTMKRSVRE